MIKLIIGTLERKILSILFFLAIAYWLFFAFVSGYKAHPLGLYTQIPLIIIPITGGLLGLKRYRPWGGVKSAMGRVLLTLSVEMISWGAGLLIWTYYLAQGIAIPYPSPADYFFILSFPLWICGLLQLAQVVGVKSGLRNLGGKFLSALVTIIAAVVSYYLLVVIAQGNSADPKASAAQLVFNFIYTYGLLLCVIIVAVTFSLSRKYLGGRYKQPVLLLFFGLTTHFVAIFFFTYSTIHQTYFSGNIADFLFTIAVYFESLGIINLDTKLITNA